MSQKIFRSAFTLAEVLVTLGIIGVVSALTLPTLMQDHQRKVYVTQLHKVYNDFSQAGDAYIESRNASNLREAGVDSQNGINDLVQSQLKIVKNCSSRFTDCFATEYKNMNGVRVTNYAGTGSCYALPSSASICLEYTNGLGVIPSSTEGVASKVVQEYSGGIVAKVLVDVNGKSGPNIVGRDLFFLAMYRDGSMGVANPRNMCSSSDNQCNTNWARSATQKCQQVTDMSSQDASFCFAQIQNDGFVMNY